MKAVCVTSGGMDSISMALAMIESNYDVTLFHGDLKQKAQGPEHQAVQVIAEALNVDSYFVDLAWLGELGGSSLTSPDLPIPKGMDSLIESTDIESWETEGLWTPARNVVLLSCAAALAERIGATALTWGANQSETAYPDNTMEFGDRFTYMLEMGCLKPMKVSAPLYELDKPEILKWGHDRGYGWVYDHTWSCDDAQHLEQRYVQCGVCGCCMNRRFAFLVANKKLGENIVDKKEYLDPNYFHEVYLGDLKARCTPNMWMHKYLDLI